MMPAPYNLTEFTGITESFNIVDFLQILDAAAPWAEMMLIAVAILSFILLTRVSETSEAAAAATWITTILALFLWLMDLVFVEWFVTSAMITAVMILILYFKKAR